MLCIQGLKPALNVQSDSFSYKNILVITIIIIFNIKRYVTL